MIEFNGGTFGQVQPVAELFKQLQFTQFENVKAIHFGSAAELELRKAAVCEDAKSDDIGKKLESLEARINEITADQHTHGVRVYPATALERMTAGK